MSAEKKKQKTEVVPTGTTINPDQVVWRKLERPRMWKPGAIGSTLVGYFLGKTLKDGKFGQYEVAMIAVPEGAGFSRPYMVSGTSILQAIDGSGVSTGSLLRVEWKGWVEFESNGEARRMKKFDVFVGEGTITAEECRKYLHVVGEDNE